MRVLLPWKSATNPDAPSPPPSPGSGGSSSNSSCSSGGSASDSSFASATSSSSAPSSRSSRARQAATPQHRASARALAHGGVTATHGCCDTSASPRKRRAPPPPRQNSPAAFPSDCVVSTAVPAASRKRRSTGSAHGSSSPHSSSSSESIGALRLLLDSKPAARRTTTTTSTMTAGGFAKHPDEREGWSSSSPPPPSATTNANANATPLVRYYRYLSSDGDPECMENEPHTDYQAQSHTAISLEGAAVAAATTTTTTPASAWADSASLLQLRDCRTRSGSTSSGGDSAASANSRFVPTDATSHAFVEGLKRRGLEIVEQDGDGNCLFRAVALQVYGDSAAHPEVRKLCCDFMAHDPDHFGEFVDEDFAEYIARKRLDGVHGNNPELQALCELFNRPLEVYTPEAGPHQPINIFHGEYKTSDVPIRLSYHDGNHYNAVIDPILPTAGLGLGLPGLQPGLADQLQVAQAVAASDQLEDERELQRAVRESQLEYQLATDDALQRAIKDSAFSIDHIYKDKALALSDLDATNFELEQKVLVDSMLLLQQEQGRKQRAQGDSSAYSTSNQPRRRDAESSPLSSVAVGDVPVPADASLVPTVASAAATSTLDSIPTAASVATAAASVSAVTTTELRDSPLLDSAEYPETVQELVMNGFELSRVVRAYELIGDNFDDLFSFLFSQQQH